MRDRTGRREFMQTAGRAAGGAVAASAIPSWAQAAAPAVWGAQIYTVRSLLPTKPAETLKQIAAIGYKEVELLRAGLTDLIPMVKDAGLQAPSVHIESAVVTGDWSGWKKMVGPAGAARLPESYGLDAAIADAKRYGISFLTVSYLVPQERGTLDFYRRFIDAMNAGAEKCAAASLTLAYHSHSFEFAPLEGQLPMELLLAKLDKRVGLELDVFWWSMAGRDPAKSIAELGPRVRLVHLKDRAKESPNELLESKVAKSAFVELGKGSLDFPAILAAAKKAGVAHAFVEQDQTPGDPLESLATSYRYLSGLGA